MNKHESKYFNTAVLMDEAFLILLQNKEYEYITVKEVCKKAGVNRSTFYLHYENMGDLLQESIALINRRFQEAFSSKKIFINDVKQASKRNSFLITPQYLLPYLNFVAENKKIFKLICSRPALFNSENAFNGMYEEIFKPILDKFGVAESEQPYVFSYYFGAVASVVMKWVELDCKKPVGDVITIITECMSVAVQD